MRSSERFEERAHLSRIASGHRRVLTPLIAGASALAGLAALLVFAAPASASSSVGLVPTNPIAPTAGSVSVAVDSSTGVIYSSGYKSEELDAIDGATNALIAAIPLGFPAGSLHQESVAVDPVTHAVYVISPSSAQVAVIDGSTNTISATIALPAVATGVAVDPQTDRVYLASAGAVFVLDGATNAVTSIAAPATAWVSVNSVTNTVYATSSTGLAVIDGATATVRANVAISGTVYGATADEANNDVYLWSQPANTAGGPLVETVVSGATDTIVGTIPNGGHTAVNTATDQVFIAPFPTDLVDVDGATNTIAGDIPDPTAGSGEQLAVNQSTGNVYMPTAVDIRVYSAPIVITSAAPSASLVQGVDYSERFTASGVGAITYAVTSGTLPTGIALDGASGILSGVPAAGGTFSYSITATDAIGGAVTTAYSQRVIGIDRVAGGDRYSTSVAVSEQEYPAGAPVVFIADGQNFPDALSAGPAAAAMGGPVLLTAPGWIPAQVSDEISRLKPSKIVVVGGTVSVSASVFSELHGLVSNTVRWAGADRYATSRAVAANAFPNGSAGVFIATATNFPDALAAGAVAASFGEPILLLDGREPWLSDADVTALNALGPSRIDIVGGTASVSSGVEADLNTGGAIVSRWAGQDRYETAERLNEAFYNTSGTNGAQPGSTTVFLATGTNFPDALSAGPWAGGIAVAPLYSVPAGCVPQQVLADINGLGATQVVLIGGTATLTSGVAALTPCG